MTSALSRTQWIADVYLPLGETTGWINPLLTGQVTWENSFSRCENTWCTWKSLGLDCYPSAQLVSGSCRLACVLSLQNYEFTFLFLFLLNSPGNNCGLQMVIVGLVFADKCQLPHTSWCALGTQTWLLGFVLVIGDAYFPQIGTFLSTMEGNDKN